MAKEIKPAPPISNETEYLRITKDWQVIKGDNPQTVNSEATLYWIMVKDSIRTHTTSYNNTYRLRDYTFLNNKGKVIRSLENDAFRIASITHVHTSWNPYEVSIADSSNHWRNEIFGDPIQALNRLEELSQYGSWREYDLLAENEQLETKVEQLQEEIEDLQIQFKELKKRKRAAKARKKKS